MCVECWERLGKPQLDSTAIREAVDAIAAVYEHSLSGGNLRGVLEDWNLDDEDLHAVQDQLEQRGSASAGHAADRDDGEQLATEVRCLELLRALSVDERASALAGYFRWAT